MRIGDVETDNYSVDELEIIRNEYDFKVSNITNQLMQAKEEFNQTGKNTDPIWLNNARLALSRTRLNAKQLNVVIRSIRKNEDLDRQKRAIIRKDKLREGQKEYDQKFERVFIRVARENLESELFQWLVGQAQDKVSKLKLD